jgi:LysR family transcriptional regulator, low CO2-responsive transcriptional regulator
MTQPAVSNHLRALEERFGVVLLVRGGRNTQSTPAGECLAQHARRVLEEVHALEADIARHVAPQGRLLLPRLAIEFSARYPDVALNVHIADTDETIDALLRRDFEVAIVGREVDDPRLIGVAIGRDELVVVVAASDPLAGDEVDARDLAERPFVLREEGSASRRAVEDTLASARITPRVAMELGSNAAVAGAVAAGAGIGVVPARTVETQSAVSRLKVRGLAFVRPFVLVTERNRPLSPAAEAFIGICTGTVPSK